jgi:ATP-dependent protease ClpP protease subunit
MKLKLYGTIGASLLGGSVSAADLVEELDARPDEAVALYINSGGGDVFEGVAIYNALRRHNGRVTVYVDGLAASAASLVAMAGDEVVMPANTMMMVHNPWTFAIGDADELRKSADILDKMRDALVSAYRAKTGLGDDDLKALLADETWLTAQEAVAWKFADRIEEPLEEEDIMDAFASVNLKAFRQVPQAVEVMAKRATKTAALDAANPKGDTMGQSVQGATEQARPQNVDVETIRAEAMRAERDRRTAIVALGTKVGLERSRIDSIVDQGLDVMASQGLLIDAIAEQQRSTAPVIAGVHGHVSVQADAHEKFAAGVTQAIMARAGLDKQDGKNSLTGYSLVELARKSLEINGHTATGSNMDVAGRVFLASAGNGLTHTAGDFTHILKDVAHKAMLRGWEEQPETFEAWTRAGNLSDFKINHRVGLNLADNLLTVPEGAEFQAGTIGDRGETIQLATYGRLFGISRQAIINDDLSAFTMIPQRMGRAARRTVGNLVYNVLINGQVMTEDSVQLFHADHKNLKTTAFGATALKEIKEGMRLQKDPGGKANLNITPSFLIVPAALEVAAYQLLNSPVAVGATNAEPNPYAGMAQLIVDGRLDTASSTKFYAAASPAAYDTIEVAYLNGVQAPFIDQQEGFSIDGVQYKVRIDVGVRALDFRGLFKSGT